MKKKDLFRYAIRLMILVMMFFLSSCKQGELVRQMTPDETGQENAVIVRDIDYNGIGTASSSLNPEHKGHMKINWQKWYQSNLERVGVYDFSTESLIDNLNNEKPVIRLLSVSLLGERKELSALGQMEDKLQDKSFQVRLATTQALLKMDNRKGVAVLKEFSDVVSTEVEAGNHKNLTYLHDALRVLADAGEVSAIPHLRKLQKHPGPNKKWLRLEIVRSLGKLHSKDSTVSKDIEYMLNDEDLHVRETAAKVLQKIEAKQLGTQG